MTVKETLAASLNWVDVHSWQAHVKHPYKELVFVMTISGPTDDTDEYIATITIQNKLSDLKFLGSSSLGFFKTMGDAKAACLDGAIMWWAAETMDN